MGGGKGGGGGAARPPAPKPVGVQVSGADITRTGTDEFEYGGETFNTYSKALEAATKDAENRRGNRQRASRLMRGVMGQSRARNVGTDDIFNL